MMLGDFDWGELGAEHPVTAKLWFWSYMIVMMLLMLNMLMAIIMDKYTEVKTEAENTDPIWTQVMSMAKERVAQARGTRIPESELIRVVESMKEEEVDEATLMKYHPDLRQEQATEIINATTQRVEDGLNAGVTMSEAMRHIGWVQIAVQKIGWSLEKILKAEEEERKLLRGVSDKEDEAPGQQLAITDDLGAEPNVLAITAADGGAAVGGPPYVYDTEGRLDETEQSMTRIENFLQEALQYTTFRGKDFRNRLAVIEDMIRSQRDASMLRVERDVWDAAPPRLGNAGIDGTWT
jgi:hypothetical protein